MLWLKVFLVTAHQVAAVDYFMSNSSVSTCSGNFYDSGGSGGSYSGNENSVMTFSPGVAGQYISFNFVFFSTGAQFDMLYVYDGMNTSAPLMGIYSGSVTPGQIGARNPSGALTFKFVSDGSTHLSGWVATISCSATPVSTGNFAMSDGAVDTICSANFYDSGGPSANYFNNENKTMTFYPATPGTYISAVFSIFAT